MRNHILLKFLAVTLASLMLLTAAVSGLGLLVLAEESRNNQPIEERRDEEIQHQGSTYANQIATRYASIHLGGCPEALVRDRYNFFYYSQNFTLYGYNLLDSEGNILDTDPVPDNTTDTYESYRFPVTGTYMHLISTVPEDQRDQHKLRYSLTIEDAENVIDNYLDGTVDVAEFRYSFQDGSSSSVGADTLGVLSHEGGAVVFRTASPDILEELWEQDTVSYLSFLDADGCPIYEASFPGSSGVITSDGSGSGTIRPLPGGVSDAYTTVYHAVFTDRYGDTLCNLETGDGIGVFYYDLDGYAVFRANGSSIGDGAATGPVRGVNLYGEDDTPIYSSLQPEDVGTLFVDDMDRLCFTSSAPARVAVGNAREARPEPLTPTGSAEDASPETPTEPETVPTVAETPDGTETDGASDLQSETVPVTDTGRAAPAPGEQSDEPVLIAGKPLSEYEVHTTTYYDGEPEEHMSAEYVFVPMEGYTVELYMAPTASWITAWNLLAFAYQNRVAMTVAFGVSLLLFALLAVYLCCAAGHTPGKTEVRAGGLNRTPLDLYGGLAALAICGIAAMAIDGWDYLLGRGMVGISILCYGGYACALLIVGFCFAFAAQAKTPEMFLLKNSLCGRLWRLAVFLLTCCFKACLWLLRKSRSFLGNLCHSIAQSFARVYGLLPMTWQWLLTACALLLILLITFLSGDGFLILLGLAISIAIVLYGIYSFGVLLQGVKRMRSGNLEQKVDAKGLIGSFREFAQELNGLSEVAVVAAREQMKSERMRSELITNVSHDIKTPLTSIINFVDLLQKPHTPEEEKSYLDVLSRQSDRLKKLIDDLMEMSKASTGNLSVDIARVDAAEAVNQALGEFGDKLANAHLAPVFHQPKEPVMMLADGRLAWRAMSNLLSNAVKYALPGTRLYIDLTRIDGSVMISFKNISREMLNISADELMERFVRGDSSRNTEGSGLGLNIAKSLMELQKGRLQLLVDGDLFKATLVFPAG